MEISRTVNRLPRRGEQSGAPRVARPTLLKLEQLNDGSIRTRALVVTVTISETPGVLSELCPSPGAAPVQYALSVKKKVSATATVYRGLWYVGHCGPGACSGRPRLAAAQPSADGDEQCERRGVEQQPVKLAGCLNSGV